MGNPVKIAAKLYECRDTAKRFFRDEFPEKIKPYQNVIKGVMKKHELDVLPAILFISKTETYQSDGMIQLLFMAAACELLEPSVGVTLD